MVTKIDFDDDEPKNPNARSIEFFPLILRYLWLLILFGGMGTGAAYLNFLKQPPTFQASSTILVQSERQQQAISFGSAPGIVQNASQMMPHRLLLSSPLVIEKAVEKHRLKDHPVFAGAGDPASILASGLGVSMNGEAGEIYQLSFRANNPEMCQVALQAVIDSYESFLGETHQTISEDVVKLISEAKDVLLAQLTEKEAAYRKFRQESPLLFGNAAAGATNIHQARLAGIETTRAALLIERRQKDAERTSLKDAIQNKGRREAIAMIINGRSASTDANSSSVQSPLNQLFPMLLEEQMLLDTLGPDHPKVTSVQKRIELTRKFLTDNLADDSKSDPGVEKRDLVSIYLDSLDHEIALIDSKQIAMDELFQAEQKESRNLTVEEVKDETLRNDIARTSQLFEGVVKRLDEISLVKNYGGYKMSVISAPGRGQQTGPVLSRFLLAGGAAGIAVGLALAYLLEVNDRSFRNPEEVQTQLGLPVIGHIPVIELTKAERKGGADVDPSIVTFGRPKSRLAEAYRAIRTALYFSTRGEHHKVIQVTSPNPGDGKSTLCSNLAVSIAQSGKRVLLIDADFRRPRVHKLFGLSEETGMSSVIAGTIEIADAVQTTPIDNLFAMACGPKPDNPAELLTGKRFEELLSVLKEQYDFVLIDTPPLLAVTDPSAVAPRVDGVLVTIRITKRTRSEAQRAVELLEGVGAKVLGVVVNGVGGNDGYGYSSYHYGYGSRGYGYTYGEGKAGVYYSDENKLVKAARNGQN